MAARYNPAEGESARIVYILYLVSLIVGVTSIIGVIMAYVYRADAPQWVQTHYRFQIRTFWIGLLYAFLSLLTAIIIVGLFFWGVHLHLVDRSIRSRTEIVNRRCFVREPGDVAVVGRRQGFSCNVWLNSRLHICAAEDIPAIL